MVVFFLNSRKNNNDCLDFISLCLCLFSILNIVKIRLNVGKIKTKDLITFHLKFKSIG